MTLPKIIAEVEKLNFNAKPTVLSKLKSSADLLAKIPEAKHLLAPETPERVLTEGIVELPKSSPDDVTCSEPEPVATKPTQSDKAKTKRGVGSAMPVGG